MHWKTELCFYDDQNRALARSLEHSPFFLERSPCRKNKTHRLKHNSQIACTDCICYISAIFQPYFDIVLPISQAGPNHILIISRSYLSHISAMSLPSMSRLYLRHISIYIKLCVRVCVWLCVGNTFLKIGMYGVPPRN